MAPVVGTSQLRTMRLLGAGLLVAVLAGVLWVRRPISDPAVQTIPFDKAPWAVAVDARTGYTFIVDHAAGSGGPPGGSGGGSRGGAGGFSGGYFGEGSLSILDLNTGKVLRSVSVGPDPRQVAVDERSERVFVTNDDNATVSVLDARTGTVLGALSVGQRPHAVTVDPSGHHAFVANTADNTISVLDAARALVQRTMHVSSDLFLDSATLAAGGDRIVVGGAGAVYVLDAHSGTIMHSIALDGPMALDAAAGQLYVAGAGGVRVLGLTQGHVRRVIPVNGTVSALALDARRHRLFVLRAGNVNGNGVSASAGSVSVIDTRSGAVLRTLPAGVAPGAMAIDEQTGRAVIVNAGGQVSGPDLWGWLPHWLRSHLPFLPGSSSTTRTVPGSVTVIDLSRQ